MRIKFSSDYPKLWGQKTAELLQVRLLADINPDLIEYDTKNSQGEYYQLPDTPIIQLIFVGDKNIPFCTLRRYYEAKWEYYTDAVGERFKIEVSK